MVVLTAETVARASSGSTPRLAVVREGNDVSRVLTLFTVANQAFQGKTWVNDKRHTWKQWKYGHSTLAVDGQENTNLPNCAIMDNYYVDKPVFMVDLGSQSQINGVVILTWQGQGQGELSHTLRAM